MNQHNEALLLSGVQTVKSMRDTGYKSTDYAIAELIDNAVDAAARNVTVAIVEEAREGATRLTHRATEIVVIDDGSGMDDACANLALSFGGSGNYNSRESIGRFGMGLPQASVSQCRKTEVWSWQNVQPDRAHRTCLSLDDIEANSRSLLTVPWPTGPGENGHEVLPRWVQDLYTEYHRTTMRAGQPTSSGTAIRWTELDRLRWVKASTVVKHTEFLLGRIYRRFISDKRLRINLVILERDQHGGIKKIANQEVRANDPMYLLSPESSVLEYWEKEDPDSDSGSLLQVRDEPPFMEREQIEKRYEIPRGEGNGNAMVIVRYSEAQAASRPGPNAGARTRLGKHARDNRGISIVRADRELVLEQTLVNEPTDRWWGVEVEFPPELDEIFGVTNNKQDAPYFTTAMRYVIDNELTKKEAESEGLFAEDDPISHLYQMVYDIRSKVGAIKGAQKKQQKASVRNKQPAQSPVAQAASQANKQRSIENPTPGEVTHQQQGITVEQAVALIMKELPIRYGIPKEHAAVVANHYKQGVTVHFLEAGQSQSPAFFWPDEVYNDEQIYINTEHPAYELMIDPLRLSSEEIDALPEERAKRLLGAASDGLALLLQSFARLELELGNDPRGSNRYQSVREEWGRRLRELVAEPALIEIFDDVDDE